MDRISIEDSLRWVQRFLAREWQLALPVALAFIALPSLVSTLVLTPLLTPLPQTMVEMQARVAGLPGWLLPFWLACAVVTLLGGLALTALALLPQVSVGEAIHTAARRLGAGVGVAAVVWVAVVTGLVVLGIGAAGLGLSPAGLTALGLVAIAAGALFVLLLLPLIVDRRVGPVTAILAGRRFYRGNVGRLIAAILLYVGVSFVAALAIQIAVGSLVIAAAALAGAADVGRLLATIITATLTAFQVGGLFLLVAGFYRMRVGRA